MADPPLSSALSNSHVNVSAPSPWPWKWCLSAHLIGSLDHNNTTANIWHTYTSSLMPDCLDYQPLTQIADDEPDLDPDVFSTTTSPSQPRLQGIQHMNAQEEGTRYGIVAGLAIYLKTWAACQIAGICYHQYAQAAATRHSIPRGWIYYLPEYPSVPFPLPLDPRHLQTPLQRPPLSVTPLPVRKHVLLNGVQLRLALTMVINDSFVHQALVWCHLYFQGGMPSPFLSSASGSNSGASSLVCIPFGWLCLIPYLRYGKVLAQIHPQAADVFAAISQRLWHYFSILGWIIILCQRRS